jgi:hypothetical protein
MRKYGEVHVTNILGLFQGCQLPLLCKISSQNFVDSIAKQKVSSIVPSPLVRGSVTQERS